MKKSRLAKVLTLGLAAVMMFSLASCGGGGDSAGGEDITVVSREEGSGTRDAFTELTGVLADDVDNTVDTAEISNSTSVVIQSVAGNSAAIGYISLGSLDDSVKAVQVDGVDATVENVTSGDYKLQRPFNIVTNGEVGELPQDFIDFIMSADGQAIIEEEGYIKINDSAEAYEPSGLEGTITLAGSTSVSPVMEVLADEYKALNSGVTIEIQQTGSGAGIQSTIEGVCDIGMASRELEDEEAAEGLTSQAIALDGIAVIVNSENSVDNLTTEQIRQIFTGEITNWADVTAE
ncbi:substrate-binding domain-containing protein [Gallibacter sp. Marseille-QA0791]|uniref:substrate-binding domain-containing protein n=1 Tax=Gallibacter sp. Marseille-QA0791 TaxID=3378781 RepID=UPI003D09BD86